MPIQYDIDAEGVIHGRPFGILTTEEVVGYLQEVIADQRRKDRYREIFFLESVDEFRLDAVSMQKIVEFARENITIYEGGKVAYVAAGDFEFGMGRVLEAYASGLPLELRTFRNIEDAHAWVESV